MACKNTVFHCQICKFVGFLLPSSSWLLKLPIERLREHGVKRKILENVTLRFHNWILKRETGDLLGSLRSRNR